MSETQVIDTDLNKSVISALASGRPVQAAPAVDQPMPPTNGQAQGKDIEIVKEAPAAPVTPVTEAPATPAVETDPFLSALRGTTDTPAAWADEAKNLFKQTFGEDDPFAYKTRIQQELAEKEEFKQRAVQGDNITAALKKIEQENPVLHAAFLEQLEGRDALQYIASLPNATILGKSSKDIADKVLLKTYLGDKFSTEEWKAIETNDFSELGVEKEVVDAKIKTLRPAAEFMHDQRNQEHNARIQSREQAIAAAREADTKTRAAAIAAATSDPYAKLYVNQETIQSFRDGKLFQGVFTQEDGALHPNAFTAAIKAKHYDSDVKRAYAAGMEAGKQSGLQEGTAQLPNARPGQRVVATQEQSQVDPNRSVIAQALKS